MENPTILMIHETKCTYQTLEKIAKTNWYNSNFIVVDGMGSFGGLSLFWNPREIMMDNFDATPRTLSTSFHFIGMNKNGFITNIYGPQVLEKKSF